MRAAAFLLAGLVLLAWGPPERAAADFVGHGAPVRDVALSPDGVYAATAGFDDLAILWSVSRREQLTRFYGHEAAVNAVAFLPALTPDGRPRVATASDDGTARIWDGQTGALVHRLDGHEKKVVAVDATTDGGLVATASWDRTVRLWDARDGALLRVFEGHKDSVNDVAFTPDGTALVSGGYDGDIWVWPIDGETPPYRMAKVGFPINAIAVARDGVTLVTGSADRIVRVWNLKTRAQTRELTGHEGAVLTVAISPDGETIATGGVGGALYLWDGGDAPKLAMQLEHYRAVWSIAFTPDAERLYAGGIDSVVRGWDAETGASIIGEATAFRPVERVPRALASSEDPIERGSYQFRKCAICHGVEEDGVERSGPSLAGLFGRRAGTYPGYQYSDALDGSDVIWTEETVSELFDAGPDVMFPGTKMPIQRLTDPGDLADLVAFLKFATDAR
jgi:cytochrome c